MFASLLGRSTALAVRVRVSVPNRSLAKTNPGSLVQAAASMVRIFPPVLGLSPEKNLEPKLTWLRKNLDLDEEHVLVLIKVGV